MSKRPATRDELLDMFTDKLSQSALTPKHATALKFDLVTGTEAATLKVPILLGGFKIPYFNLDGSVSSFWRYRYLESTLSGFDKATKNKGLRYVQPKGSLNQIYLPPLVDWKTIANDTTQSIVITEGELKAACACAHEIPTIGLGGVWCFRSSNAHLALLEQFDEFKWKDRTVRICYDSDAGNNTNIMAAENALAKELVRLGAWVQIVRMPTLQPPAKTGIDDFIASEGAPAFIDLLQEGVDWQACKELFELNEEVVYAKDPGVIIQLETMQRLSIRSFIDHAYAHRRYMEEVVSGRGTRMVERSAPAEWIKWPCRSVVERVTYAPGQQRITDTNDLNTWTGWGCLPVEGEMGPWHELMDYVFQDEPQFRNWFEQWLAYPLQHPGTKMFTACVFWGTKHGTGKTYIAETMRRIYGKNCTEIGDQNLQGSFNDYAVDKQFIIADEITGGDKRHASDRMKSMITQKELRVNQKYIPSYTVPDCVNYYFTSNHPDAFFIEDADRRFFIHEMGHDPLPNIFYKVYGEWLNNGGDRALFDYLLNLDLSGFSAEERAPVTRSKIDMIDNGRSDIGAWVAMLKTQPEAVLRVGEVELPYHLATAQELHSLYDRNSTGKTTHVGMARELARQSFRKANHGQPVQTDFGRHKLWIVRDIANWEDLGEQDFAVIYRTERGASCVKKVTTKY